MLDFNASDSEEEEDTMYMEATLVDPAAAEEAEPDVQNVTAIAAPAQDASPTAGASVEAEEAPAPSGGLVTEAEGYTLAMSSKSNTGYFCVSKIHGNTFKVTAGSHVATFTTALEGAVYRAKYLAGNAPAPTTDLVTEMEGYTLELSSKSKTGYAGVTELTDCKRDNRFQVSMGRKQLNKEDQSKHFGGTATVACCATAVDAALYRAKYIAAAKAEREQEPEKETPNEKKRPHPSSEAAARVSHRPAKAPARLGVSDNWGKASASSWSSTDAGFAAPAAPAPALNDDVVTEAEGYTLPLSKYSNTGYLGVSKINNGGAAKPFKVQAGSITNLAQFATALEGAVYRAKYLARKGLGPAPAPPAPAPAPAPTADLVTEMEGYTLELSSKSKTGYAGVVECQDGIRTNRFQVSMGRGQLNKQDLSKYSGKSAALAYCATAVEAALYRAKYLAGHAPVPAPAPAPAPTNGGLITEMEGYTLELSSRTMTGYAGVADMGTNGKNPFQVTINHGSISKKDRDDGKKNVYIYGATAVEAALARAKYLAAAKAENDKKPPPAPPAPAARPAASAASAATPAPRPPSSAPSTSTAVVSSSAASTSTALVVAGPLMAEVSAMLAEARLSMYADKFDDLGYDDLLFLQDLANSDKLRQIAVDEIGMKPGHASKLVDYLKGKRWGHLYA